jgi:putative membrane protein
MVIHSRTAQDWKAAGHSDPGLPSPFFAIGPWIFAALCAALIVRTLATRRRYRAVDVLTPTDEERVRAAIVELEGATAADVVPLIVERSDPHTHTILLAAAAFAAVANLTLLALLPSEGFARLGLAELGLLAAGLAFAKGCPEFRRWFLTRERADATCGEQALIELSRLTQGKGSPAVVLLFVSLFERRVVVLASSPAAGAVAPEHWPKVVEAVLGSVRRGHLADGIIAGVQACAGEVKLAFPPGESRENHFADRAIVRRE